MGNLSLYVAREPPSTSLATVLAQKDRSFTCWSFASWTRSLATPFTHSLESDSITLFWRIIRSSLSCYYPQGAQQPRCILSYRNKRSVANHIDKPLPASARIDRAGEARRGWMSERLKESVLKTEVLIGIPGVRIPLHPRSHKFSLALSIDKNESDRLDWYDRWNG